MNRKLFFGTILISLIFFINQLNYFCMVIKNLDTYLFIVLFIFCIVLFAIALLLLLKYCPNTLNRLELSSAFIILFSMLFISLISNGINSFVPITNYMGYAAILLGGIGYFKNRHRINLSFLLWGVSSILWLCNLYNAMYFEEGRVFITALTFG